MNKLKTDIDGKFPYVLDDIRFLDTAYRMGFDALAKAVSFNRNSILWGCQVTKIGGNNIDVADGAVMINGEILRFEQTQIDVTAGNKAVIIRDETFDTAGYKLFGDGTAHDTYQIIKGKLVLVPEANIGDFVDILTSPRISEISDFDGLIYKSLLTNSDNLNDINKTGLYIIKGASVPVNFPQISGVAPVSAYSNYWLKTMYVGQEDKYYQELGFKKGIIARRYLQAGTAGWSEWFNFWASDDDASAGIKKCAVISPYTLIKSLASVPQWINVPASDLSPRWSFGNGGYLKYRKLNNGLKQIRAMNLIHDYSQSYSDNNDLIYTLPPFYRPEDNTYKTASIGNSDDDGNDAAPYINETQINDVGNLKINSDGKLLFLGYGNFNSVIRVHFDIFYFY
ncbi:MAG: hypothetical protein L3J56_13090 [Bacteroidales bacterium]|nr:hypothetical protein [Bacteroidales bacterium]